MTLKQAVQILKKHQAWRLGKHDNPVTPQELTQAINVILENLLQ